MQWGRGSVDNYSRTEGHGSYGQNDQHRYVSYASSASYYSLSSIYSMVLLAASVVVGSLIYRTA